MELYISLYLFLKLQVLFYYLYIYYLFIAFSIITFNLLSKMNNYRIYYRTNSVIIYISLRQEELYF